MRRWVLESQMLAVHEDFTERFDGIETLRAEVEKALYEATHPVSS
jgi:hypothetical protein